MRMILGFLAVANLRWATADLARTERLMRDADEAHDAAELRMSRARQYLERAIVVRT